MYKEDLVYGLYLYVSQGTLIKLCIRHLEGSEAGKHIFKLKQNKEMQATTGRQQERILKLVCISATASRFATAQ